MPGWFGRRWASVKDAGRYLVERPVRLAAVGGAVLAGAVVGAPAGDAGYDYMWRNSDFCNDCHVHDYADEAWTRSIHYGVTTCHDCHLVPVMHYPLMMFGTVTDRPETPEEVANAHVPNVICETCHVAAATHALTGPMTDEVKEQIVKIDESPLHRIHLDSKTRDAGAYLGADHGTGGEHGGEAGGEEPPAPAPAGEEHGEEGGEEGGGHGEGDTVIACMDCHGSGGDAAAHRFVAVRANCLECHGGVDVAVGRLNELRCQECHFSGFVGRSLTRDAAAP